MSVETAPKRLGGRHRDGRFVSLDYKSGGLGGACRAGHYGYCG